MIANPNVHFTGEQSSPPRHDVLFQHQTVVRWGIDVDGVPLVEETNGHQYSNPLLHVMCELYHIK
jgi:hypothetical protein